MSVYITDKMKLGSKYDLFNTPAIRNTNRFTEVNICKFLKIHWKQLISQTVQYKNIFIRAIV